MTTKLPTKVYNFGQTEYTIYTDFEYYDDGVKMKVPAREMKQNVAPYLIMCNNNQELVEYLKKYAKYFKKYIQITNETLFEKDKKTVTAKKIKIKDSFLAYFIQAKDRIYNIFNEEREKRVLKYKILNFDEIKKEYYPFDRTKKLNGTYTLKLKDLETNEIVYKQFNFFNNSGYCDNKRFVTSLYNINKNMVELRKENYNVYNDFLKKLEQYFEQINTDNNNDWDEYLNKEVNKLAKYLNNEALTELQKEYEQEYKRRLNKNKKI